MEGNNRSLFVLFDENKEFPLFTFLREKSEINRLWHALFMKFIIRFAFELTFNFEEIIADSIIFTFSFSIVSTSASASASVFVFADIDDVTTATVDIDDVTGATIASVAPAVVAAAAAVARSIFLVYWSSTKGMVPILWFNATAVAKINKRR